MIRANRAMRERAGERPLDLASWDAVPASLRQVIDGGWVVEPDGAHLLAALRDGYHGSRAAFKDLTGYEASVNGIGIPDWDIESVGDTRVAKLLVRSISYAKYSIAAANMGDAANLTAVVSMAPSLSGDLKVTARVTFFLDRIHEPSLVDDAEAFQAESILAFKRSDIELSE